MVTVAYSALMGVCHAHQSNYKGVKLEEVVVGNRVALLAVLLMAQGMVSAEVNITRSLHSFEVDHGDTSIEVKRQQNPDAVITGPFAKVSRPCPPLCVQPHQVADGVKTIGIRELVDFMQTELAVGEGLLIDARTPDWHARGTIPGSINLPYTVMNRKAGATELDVADTFEILGVVEDDSGWIFSEAAHLVLWCNGNWCGQSPAAIRGLLAEGYPADKIAYFRGGMEDWVQYGMTVVIP